MLYCINGHARMRGVPNPGPLRRLLPWLVALVLLGVVAA